MVADNSSQARWLRSAAHGNTHKRYHGYTVAEHNSAVPKPTPTESSGCFVLNAASMPATIPRLNNNLA